jgi:hypothetical protein
MSDYLAERLKTHAAEQQRKKQIETEPRPLEQQSLQTRGEAFISMNARSEYEHLVRLLKKRAEQIRSEIGDLREIVITGSYIQIGHVALYYRFDQPNPNQPNNELVLSIGLAPYKSFMVENPPQPVTHKLTAGAAPDFSRIVWVGIGAGGGRLGQLDSAMLAEFAADLLVEYYCKHTKR